MEDTDSVATLIDSTTSKIQQLQKAFAELESHRAVTLNLKWKELEEHFHGLERSLKRRFHELEDQEREYETKIRKSREILEKREAAVVAKEQASLGRLQEKRDTAVFAITNALEKHRKKSADEPVVVTRNCQYESPTVEDPPPDKHRKISAVEPVGVISDFHGESSSVEDPSPDVFTPDCLSGESKISLEGENFDGRSYPQLVKLCVEMDLEGLHKFISDNRKDLAVLREEIPLALEAAADPAQLVLNSLEDFYPMELSNVDGKKDSVLLGVRRTCIMLMECLSIMLMSSDLDLISEDVRDQAKEIAYDWKPKLETLDMDASNGNSLEAHAFLQLLATYGIASDFDEDILCRLIPMVSRRRQAADLCRCLGLSEKMPGVIEVLINSGRHIDAVNLAFAFELTEQFSPVLLLKAYLKDVRKASPLKPGNTSPNTAQNEINERELAALKAVIRCIEEHKLEEQYPVDPLQKRLLQLEKAKEDKKRATETAKPLPKRPRANAVGCAPRAANVANVAADKTFHPRVTDRYPHYVYDRSFVYPVPADNHVPHIMGSATYNFTPNHGNFFGNGYQYPTPYLH